MCLKSEAVYFMNGRFVVIFDTCKQCHSSLILKSVNKTNGFTVLCVSILFKFEISCLCESVFKFNANLVMFTTINIYETILNKYYVHHILKICIYTGMTATTKFVLCHTRQHLNLPVVTSSLTFSLCT